MFLGIGEDIRPEGALRSRSSGPTFMLLLFPWVIQLAHRRTLSCHMII